MQGCVCTNLIRTRFSRVLKCSLWSHCHNIIGKQLNNPLYDRIEQLQVGSNMSSVGRLQHRIFTVVHLVPFPHISLSDYTRCACCAFVSSPIRQNCVTTTHERLKEDVFVTQPHAVTDQHREKGLKDAGPSRPICLTLCPLKMAWVHQRGSICHRKGPVLTSSTLHPQPSNLAHTHVSTAISVRTPQLHV